MALNIPPTMPPILDYFKESIPQFSSSDWTFHANATVGGPDGRTLTLNSTGAAQISDLYVNVIPGAKYRLACNVSATAGEARISVRKTPGSGAVDDLISPITASGSTDFTVPLGVTRLRLLFWNSASGAVCTFSNPSLKLAQPDDYSKELIVNGDFSRGAEGWTLHQNAQVVGGKLVLDAQSSANHFTMQSVKVLPNTRYVVTAKVSSLSKITPGWTGGFANFLAVAEGVLVGEFTTPAHISTLTVNIGNGGVAGTYTFDDISLKRKMPD